MVIESETEEVHEARRTALELLFSDHVGDCLSPCNRLCPLGLNVPVMIRHIEAQQLNEATVNVRQALPLAAVLGRLCHHPCEQGCRRGMWDDPAMIRDMEKFVADEDLNLDEPYLAPRKPATGKSVLVVGSGPAGLAAAWFLNREGHEVTVIDRHAEAGGSLRTETSETDLPRPVLDAELQLLERSGIQFRFQIELGRDVRLEGLLRGFNAVLLATGDISPDEAERIGITMSGKVFKADGNTSQTSVPGVFATGAAVRPVRQLVKAMAEGKGAAECVSQFLLGQLMRRSDRPFSSIMGRLDRSELKPFLQLASPVPSVAPACGGGCGGYTRPEASTEASRCLHCDCRSSGNCDLQHWAEVYGADASRFRTQRKPFEQHVQPGVVIFEPGKCILCGLCVEIARRAGEPLGLTFVERGFNVRVAAPMNREFSEGLQKVAAECVEACPTGAIVLDGRGSRVMARSDERQTH